MCTSSPPSYKYSLSQHTKSIPYFQLSTIMEHNMQYLMWLKSKQILNSHFQASMNSFNTSWEEQAFAEDAAGPLGGFVWPPRSYSCTFCRREFRSAQALGGHMNVHRRDRARLKQSFSTEGGDSPPFSSPNSRASATVISQENSSGEAYVSPLSSSSKMELQQKQFPCTSSPDSNSVTLLSISNFTTATGRSSRKEELMVALDHDGTVETNLSIGTNLQSGSRNEDSAINSKRHKSGATFPLYHKPCSSEKYPFQCEVLRMKTTMTNSIDDIDLELRLGDSPAVK